MFLLALTFALQTKHQIMSYEQYAKVQHGRPYVLEITQGTGRLIYFGIGHTNNPGDNQIQTAKKLWQELKPEMALNESSPRVPAETLEKSVERDGESGAVAFWAREDKILNTSLDINRIIEFSELSKVIPPTELKVFYALRSFQERSRRAEWARGTRTPEEVVGTNLVTLSARGLKGSPSNVAELDAMWANWKMPADWREAQASWFDPGSGGAGTFLNRIATASSQLRDQAIIDRIVEVVNSGKRAFATMGASHVVMQEAALRSALPKATIRKLMG